MARNLILFGTKFSQGMLSLPVNLFLEQPKVEDKECNISDSLMKLIKTSAVNEGLHANSFGKVSSFVLLGVFEFIYYMASSKK